MNEKEVQFWTNENEKGAKIIQSQLIKNLNYAGYANLRINPTNYLLVKCLNNKLSRTSEHEIVKELNEFLKRHASEEVQEVFAKGVGNYVSTKKLSLLETLEFKKDRDPKDGSDFFFQNVFCRVSKDGIKVSDYRDLDVTIWENKIIKRNFVTPEKNGLGHFEFFCSNLCFNDVNRFKAFKTMIGFLLHRNKELGEPKAVILYDEKMGLNKQAHGGTGKTLIIKALAMCRESVYVSGKDLKTNSFFKNQRIDITTDLIAYDDLKDNVDLEEFYTMITSGIEVEKKGKQSFHIEYEDSPKLILSSNHLIKGDGGNSDLRRRYEFEIANFYDKDNTPEMEFGKRFFSKDWGDDQWNKFDYFMMSCLEEYLRHGLIEVDSINLKQTKISNKSSVEFIEYANEYIKINEVMDKRATQMMFEELHPQIDPVSPHQFTKWLSNYAIDYGYAYESYPSGGNYYFILEKKEIANG